MDFVFHAAALKQVPSCEFFPIEATKTNVLGSQNVVEAAIANQVKKVICLSTDKAAYPINAMGMTKALMEKVAMSATRMLPKNSTTVCCVRYGNVMCSRGSVIPLFISQIKQNKPHYNVALVYWRDENTPNASYDKNFTAVNIQPKR